MAISPASRQVIRRLARAADAIERSWSVTADDTERRALFFFDVSPRAVSVVAQAAGRLGVPTGLIDAWRTALPGCDAIGLAVRDDLNSVRLYTQYWEAVIQRVRAGKSDPTLLYAGFKALPGGVTRIDPYICLPMAPRGMFMPPIREALTTGGAEAAEVETAFAPLSAETCIYTRTEIEGRASWLATVRRAELSHAAVASALAPLTDRVPHGDEIADAAKTRDMMHIAGGEDATKGLFTTLYFAAELSDLDRFLTG